MNTTKKTIDNIKNFGSVIKFYGETLATSLFAMCLFACVPAIGWFSIPIIILFTISYIKENRFNKNKDTTN